MKTLLQILIFSLFPIFSFATAQAGDIIIFKNDTLSLFSNPLEQYLESKPERTINGHKLNWTSTACYRGYRATWEIKNDSLFLIKIQKGCYNKVPEYFNLKKEFNAERVYANWFTGKLLAPNGKQIHYVHSGYDSFYKTELEFNIKKGDLIEYSEYNNSKTYKSIYTENQDSLANFIYSNINWDSIPNLSNKSERVYVSIQSGENRKPDSIKIVKKSDIEILNREAIRVISLLPEWDVYYRRGEIHKMKWAVPVIFSESRRRKYAR